MKKALERADPASWLRADADGTGMAGIQRCNPRGPVADSRDTRHERGCLVLSFALCCNGSGIAVCSRYSGLRSPMTLDWSAVSCVRRAYTRDV